MVARLDIATLLDLFDTDDDDDGEPMPVAATETAPVATSAAWVERWAVPERLAA